MLKIRRDTLINLYSKDFNNRGRTFKQYYISNNNFFPIIFYFGDINHLSTKIEAVQENSPAHIAGIQRVIKF